MPDEYGCYRLNQEDAGIVHAHLINRGSVVFPLSGDAAGCMIVLMCREFDCLGVMPFGGRPTDRIYVGIYGLGCNHFAPAPTHWGYFAEKLRIPQGDAEPLAAFWSMMWENTPNTQRERRCLTTS